MEREKPKRGCEIILTLEGYDGVGIRISQDHWERLREESEKSGMPICARLVTSEYDSRGMKIGENVKIVIVESVIYRPVSYE